MWFFVYIVLAAQSPVVASPSDKIPCNHDVVCGKGECWEGICEADGYCQAYWTCV